jgi:hypothetical protein
MTTTSLFNAMEDIFEQVEKITEERDAFIRDAEFYEIRDLLFNAVTSDEVAIHEDAVVALDISSAAQIVEYIERSEELLSSMMMMSVAQAFMTLVPGAIAKEQFASFGDS